MLRGGRDASLLQDAWRQRYVLVAALVCAPVKVINMSKVINMIGVKL